MAVSLFWDSLVAQKSIDTIVALKQGDEVSEARLRATLEAIGPVELDPPANGDRLINQGILTLALALQLPADDPEGFELLRQAIALANARLREAPGDTHTWARLAYAEYYLNGPSELTFDALRISHLTGPYEYYLLWSRLELGILLWDQLDEDLKQMTVMQAVVIWRVQGDRQQLVWYFFQMPDAAQAGVRQLLSETEDIEAFQAMFEREARRRDN